VLVADSSPDQRSGRNPVARSGRPGCNGSLGLASAAPAHSEAIVRTLATVLLAALLVGAVGTSAEPAPVPVVVETTLATATGQVRQFAFDGDPATFFASAKAPGPGDHLTLVFDKAVALTAVEVKTGRPAGGDRLDAGTLEGSADGKKFEALARFAEGTASAKADARLVRAVRIVADVGAKSPLVVREFTIKSEPPLATFKHPVEFTLDVTDAPEMLEWAKKAARVCERNYDMICDELRSDGFKPRTTITMTLKKDYKGVAEASGGRIKGSVTYFKDHPDDLGAMVHETVHCVQNYRTRNAPGWLVEGIADYVRFFKYEPGKIGRLDTERARYDGSYRVSAAFLASVAEKYDKDLVRKLNQALREGEYREEVWKTLTKKSLAELGEEWKGALKR
jgi:hypothetical protein